MRRIFLNPTPLFCTMPRIRHPKISDPVMMRFWLPQKRIISSSITSSSERSGWTLSFGIISPNMVMPKVEKRNAIIPASTDSDSSMSKTLMTPLPHKIVVSKKLESSLLVLRKLCRTSVGIFVKALTNRHLQRFELDSTLSRRQFRLRHLNFGISDLFRISIFEFRISSLSGLGSSKI